MHFCCPNYGYHYNKKLFSECFASSLAGEDVLVAEVGQNAVLTGNDSGKKVFKLLADSNKQNINNEKFEALDSSQKSLSIFGIKEGDILDLSEVLKSSNVSSFNQNGTSLKIYLDNGDIIMSQIALGSPFVEFDIGLGNISVRNQNMTKVLENLEINMINDDSMTFTFEPKTTSTVTSTSSHTQFTDITTLLPFSDNNKHTDLGKGAIAGIVAGSVVGAIGVGIGVYFIIKKCCLVGQTQDTETHVIDVL